MAMLSQNFYSSGLRQKIDELMDILYAGGVNNPMDSIEQLSYLIFIRLLGENDDSLAAIDNKYKRIFSGEWARYHWNNFVTLTGDELFTNVRDAIERLHELPDMSSTGKLLFNRATLKIYDRPTLRAVVQSIQEMDLDSQEGIDLKGDMYEYLLNQLAKSGKNGQFRTPRHIIELIVNLVAPQPGKTIIDPACGTAGFLIATLRYILNHHTSKGAKSYSGDLLSSTYWKYLEERAFTGFDNDANMVKIAIMNLYLHGLQKADIRFFNPLTTSLKGGYPGQLYDYVFANPPFSGAIQKESILADINLQTRDTEKLFLKWFIDHLAPGGRAGVIVPNGVLFGSDKASLKLREFLLKGCDLQAVITLPSGTFKPYASVATAILIFEKQSVTKSVWFYELSADGFSMSDTRTPILDNDIPDILECFQDRKEGKKSFNVSVGEIAKHNYELMPGRYKPIDFELELHSSAEQLITEILAVEAEIQERLNELRLQVRD